MVSAAFLLEESTRVKDTGLDHLEVAPKLRDAGLLPVMLGDAKNEVSVECDEMFLICFLKGRVRNS